MEHEIDLSAECLHSPFEEVLEVFHAGSVGRYDGLGVGFLCQFVECSHANSDSGIRQYYLCTLLYGTFSNLPCYGLVVECSEDDAFLSFQ